MVAAQSNCRDALDAIYSEMRANHDDHTYINQLNLHGDFALCMAIRHKHVEMCRSLLEHRADIYMKYQGHDMIWWAKQQGKEEWVELVREFM